MGRKPGIAPSLREIEAKVIHTIQLSRLIEEPINSCSVTQLACTRIPQATADSLPSQPVSIHQNRLTGCTKPFCQSAEDGLLAYSGERMRFDVRP